MFESPIRHHFPFLDDALGIAVAVKLLFVKRHHEVRPSFDFDLRGERHDGPAVGSRIDSLLNMKSFRSGFD